MFARACHREFGTVVQFKHWQKLIVVYVPCLAVYMYDVYCHKVGSEYAACIEYLCPLCISAMHSVKRFCISLFPLVSDHCNA